MALAAPISNVDPQIRCLPPPQSQALHYVTHQCISRTRLLQKMSIFASELTLESVRNSDRGHRKIELQDPADLTYLIAKVSRAAREKIDKHLPPDAAVEGDDQMRAQVEILVDDYIKRTFDLAKPNLSINGMDSAELDAELAKAQGGEEFEAFDAKTVTKIQKLSAEIEEQTLELANLRRNAPAATAQRYAQRFAGEDEKIQSRLSTEEGRKVAEAQKTKLNVGEIERVDEIQQDWERSNAKLNNLTNGLQETIEKMDRAQKGIAHVSRSGDGPG